MLRFVVPTVYCRDPLDQMIGSSWYFHPPRAVPCRRMNSLMSLAAFVEAMEAVESAREDEKDNLCNCQKKNKPSDGATEEKHTHEGSETILEESPNLFCRTDDQAQTSSSSPSTSENTTSEAEKKSEGVSVPVERQCDRDSDRFRVSLKLNSFDPEDIEVKRVDNELKVHAKQKVERYGMIFHREIHRSFHLPDDVDVESLKSTMSTAGVLAIEAQRTPRASDYNSQQSKENQVEPTDVEEKPEPLKESTLPEESEGSEVNELQEFSFDDPQAQSSTTKTDEEDPKDSQNNGQDHEDE